MNNEINKSEDIYALFAYKVRKELKSLLDASVYVANDNDVLVIRINKGPFSFNHMIPQIGPKLLDGLTVESVVREVTELYKNRVLSWFFYKYR